MTQAGGTESIIPDCSWDGVPDGQPRLVWLVCPHAGNSGHGSTSKGRKQPTG